MTDRPASPVAHPVDLSAGVAMSTSRDEGRAQRDPFRRKGLAVGVLVLALLALLAVLAPILAPYAPDAQILADRYQPPGPAHLMGADALGRDVFSRVLWASRVSLTIGFASVVVSTLLGTAVGAAAGWAGGRWDGLLMRLTDVVLVFPPLFLMIAVVGVFGSSVPLLVIVIGITSWPLSARIVRGEILTLRTREFIDAARVLGVSGPAIVVRHLLPNAAWAILVSATLRVPAALLTEAGLSYVGLGVLPPDPSWGNMVADGKAALETAWWVSAFPGIFIALAVLGCTLAGDGLREA